MTQQTASSNFATASEANIKASPPTVLPVARVFRSNITSVGYIFKNGKKAAFVSGKYTTNIKYEIDELDTEIALGHPNFSADTEEIEAVIEPLEALRARFIAEFKADEARALNKANDAGTAEVQKLTPVSSATIADGAAGSDSTAGANTTTAASTAATAAPALAGLKISLKK